MSSFGNNSSSRTRMGIKVLLHIYDLSPMNDSILHSIGFGMYHTGIELMGIEYSFASIASIFESTTPTIVPNSKYRETILLGIYNGTQQDIYTILSDLRISKYGPNDYNLIKRNCNHFTNDFSYKLLNKLIPSYINRLANVGECCSCFIPQHLLSNAPVTSSDGLSNNNNENNNSFLVKAPAGRQLTSSTTTSTNTSSSSTSFHGTGSRLGGTTTNTGTSSNNKKNNEAAPGVSLVQHLSTFGSSFVAPLLASATSISSSATATATSTTSSSVTPPPSSSRQDDLTDRREKARKAALARLEMQQQHPMQR